MKNPWMSAWLRAMNTTLSATQAFWTELMRRQTHGTKTDSSLDTEPEMKPKAESAPTPSNGETSPPRSKASSEPTGPPRTDSKEPATAPKEAAAAKKTASSTRTAQPKKKVAPKKTAAPNKTAASEKTAAAKGTVAPKKTAPPKEEAEDSAAAKAKTGASARKFQHPTDPDLTWSGRGRRPRWVTEALEAGGSLDDLRVRKH